MSELLSVQILFTEDDPEELRLLRETLEARGYVVAIARLGEWPMTGEQAGDSIVALLGGSGSRVEELEALGAISAGLPHILPLVAIASPDKAGWVEEALHWGATDQLLRDPGGVHIRMLPAVLGRAVEHARAVDDLRRRESEIRNLFENAPICLWKEDFSSLVRRFESLRVEGVEDFRDFFDSHPEVVRELAAEVKILDVNQAVLDLHEAKEKSDLMAPLPRFFDEKAYEIFREELILLAEGGKRFEAEGAIRTLTGSPRDVLLTVFVDPNTPDGSVVHVAMVDITKLRRSEEERLELERRSLHFQRLESLGILAGGVAHDFNNILVSILGHADLAMSSLPPGSDLAQDLEPIISGAEQAADLCQQMLAFAGQGPVTLEDVDLGALVAQMRDLLRSSLPGKVRLEVDSPGGLATIQADKAQLRQVVMNLLLNAAEAIGDSAGTVTVKTTVEDCDGEVLAWDELEEGLSSGCYAVLSVTDTGCGMTEETRNRLFEPFFTTKFTGRGLGSSAILGIARSHGGTVLVESQEEQGATVKVLFPACSVVADTGELSSLSSQMTKRERSGSGLVLVVDDEKRVREVAEAILESEGYSVLLTENGYAGISSFVQHRDELICVLLDLSMPDLRGDEVLKRMREIDPEIPVILSSGFHADEVLGRLSGPAPNGFLQKPYRVDLLLDAIREAVELS